MLSGVEFDSERVLALVGSHGSRLGVGCWERLSLLCLSRPAFEKQVSRHP